MGKSGTVTITVMQDTTLSLTASKTTGYVPSTITFTATLKDSAGKALQGKSVDFYIGTTLCWTGTTDSNGTTSVDLGFNTSGTFSAYAKFAGDSAFKPSTSNTISITISKSPTTLTLAASKTTVNAGESVTFTATLISTPNSLPIANATVKLCKSDDTVVSTATTDGNGKASYTVTFSSGGSYSYYAQYDGNDQFEGC